MLPRDGNRLISLKTTSSASSAQLLIAKRSPTTDRSYGLAVAISPISAAKSSPTTVLAIVEGTKAALE